jgi:hypothetical protein
MTTPQNIFSHSPSPTAKKTLQLYLILKVYRLFFFRGKGAISGENRNNNGNLGVKDDFIKGESRENKIEKGEL